MTRVNFKNASGPLSEYAEKARQSPVIVIKGGKPVDLVKKIDDLGDRGIAPWIRGYMHTLRILGNESVHEKTSDGRIPAHLNQDDLALCLFCLQRVVEFWRDYRSTRNL